MNIPKVHTSILCLLTLLAGFMTPARAVGFANSNYSFTRIGSERGLSASNVKCILQDSKGFVWLGTKNGLNRYDGTDMHQFKVFDPATGHGNDNIGALCEDAQHNLWIGTDRGAFRYDPVTERCVYMNQKAQDGTTAYNWVQDICADRNGGIWVLIPDQGIFRFNGDKVKYYRLKSDSKNFKELYFSSMCIDSEDIVWATTAGDGLYRYDPRQDTFTHLNLNTDTGADTRNLAVVIDGQDGSLITAANDGHIFRVFPADPGNTKLISYSKQGNTYLRDIEIFGDNLWVGTHSGLSIINLKTGEETSLSETSSDPFSISDNTIYCIYRDTKGGAWIGTMYGGADYLSGNPFSFSKLGLKNGLSSRIVTGLDFDRGGTLWAGTIDHGLNRFDTASNSFHPAGPDNEHSRTVSNVQNTDNGIRVSYTQAGLYGISENGLYANLFHRNDISDSSVYTYLRDSRGDEWIGMGYALFRRTGRNTEFQKVKEAHYYWIFTMMEGSDGTIWIGTMGNGLIKYNPRSGKYTQYVFDDNAHAGSLQSNSINSIMEDHAGTVWISTDRGGLSRYNKNTDDFTTFGPKDGFPDNVVYSVLEDRRNNLWFGTNKGLVKFNPDTGTVKVFTTADGLPCNEFSYNSAAKSPDGVFYFGTTNGIVSFNPDFEEMNKSDMPLYFTQLNMLNRPVSVNDPDSPLSRNIMFTDRLKLSHRDATFSLSVASPDFDNPGKNRFSYRLLPVNDDWIPLENNKISFTNLAPGNYTLEVRVKNGDSEMSRQLQIVITPPWYIRWWAVASYILILAAVIIGIALRYKRNKERALREREENFTNNQEKELFRSKVQFFTEIAHEIRTPLTLIDIPLEAIEEMDIKDTELQRYLKIIRSNTSRLLNLSGQLLDFQKIDSNRLTLKYENVNVCELLKSTVARFEPSISLHGKKIECDIRVAQLMAWTDREALTKIISNLLNNAFKYARSYIKVILDTDSENTHFSISVASDGDLIAAEEREKIFQPFVQGEEGRKGQNGVGIGLPLSRSLAMLLQGSLTLRDSDDGLNTFALTLPVNMDKARTKDLDSSERDEYMLDEESNQSRISSEAYTLLLVEDNESIRNIIAENLRHHFFVETAANGQEALRIINEKQPDIVVSDIMMPVMDGLELCRNIKSDEKISHIPVVFITAKNDIDSKVEGLKAGAESYIEKPFSVKYLRQMVSSILDNRRRERQAFSKKPFFRMDNMKYTPAEEEFMNKVIQAIKDHISEEEFNVDSLTDILCMSRSNLLRKVRAIFNLSPSELIRTVKLKAAAEMIRDGKYRIGEICQMVGIASPSYFSKLFFKQFNITPKDFAKKCSESYGTRNYNNFKDNENEIS